jgi:hypothetical protein
LKRVALRDDPPTLVLRGIAMALLGDLDRAKLLFRNESRVAGIPALIAEVQDALRQLNTLAARAWSGRAKKNRYRLSRLKRCSSQEHLSLQLLQLERARCCS